MQSAPARNLSKNVLYAVEYPGYVENNTTSTGMVVENIGGLVKLSSVFVRNGLKNEALELNLHSSNPYCHSVPGDVVATQTILLKVTKRRQRRVRDIDDSSSINYVGSFRVEVLGAICATVRFRSG